MHQPPKTSAIKTNQSKRDVKLMQEMEQETKKILSPLFDDAVWLNRAYLMLKEPDSQDKEERFKSLVLVLNGRIKHSLKLSYDVGTLHTAKIFSHILELDSLIKEVIGLPRTPSLDHFQSFAKGILFRSMGDTFFLLHNTEKGNRIYMELAFVSYSIAYDIFYKASPVSSLLAAIFVLETLILHTLLQHFIRVKLSDSTMQTVGERLYSACGGVATSRSKSYMVSVNSMPSTNERHGIEQNKISRMVTLAEKNDFLTSLLWLLTYNSAVRDSVFFLDLFLKEIPAETSDCDLQSFTLSSFSRIDAKVLLLGAAKWSELYTSQMQKCGTPSLAVLPPIAFAQPSHMVLSFWNLLVSLINKEARIDRSSQQCSENRLIIAALEASRLRAEVPDMRIVDYVRKWLFANGNALGDAKRNWNKLYSRVFMDLINGANYSKQGVSAEDSFFPPLNDTEYDMLDDAEKWFSPQNSSSATHDCSTGDLFLNGSSELRQVDVSSTSQTKFIKDVSVKPRSFLQRICMSAKTVLPNECSDLVISACTKTDNIRLLELLSKDYESRHRNELSAGVELNDLSSLTKESKIEENLYAEIIKMQSEYSRDVCRLVQTINSLEQTLKHYAKKYALDLSFYASKAYKQGYSDGYCSTLQLSNTFTNLSESADQDVNPVVTQRSDFLESQAQQALDAEHLHNSKECIGCASEEEQGRILRMLDSLADNGIA